MEMVDTCSVLLVEKRSWENQDVQKFAKEWRFVKVGETEDSRYDVLQRAFGADTEDLKEEEEEESKVISAETIVDFEDGDDEDELVWGEHRGRPGQEKPDGILALSESRKCYLKIASWSSEDVQKLKDVGVISLFLDLELIAQKRVDASVSSVWRDGFKDEENIQGCFTQVQLALSSVTVDLEVEPSTKELTTKHVVHKIEIKFIPTELWAGEKQCIDMKVQPNDADEFTLQTTKQMTTSATLSQTPAVQVGGAVSNALTQTVKQHEWRSQLYRRTRAAAWVWSIGYWRDGKHFNPSKTDVLWLKGGGKNSAELINKVLAPSLAGGSSLHLTTTDVSATWTVDAQACHVPSFDFVVEVTLHTTVFRLVSFFEGCLGLLGSRPKRDPPYKFLHEGRLSI